jgi:hypothetical protein
VAAAVRYTESPTLDMQESPRIRLDPERFAEFDRYAGAGDRRNHLIERIGKKYQWLAFHELLARLGDNAGFMGWFQRDGIRHFQGPWEVHRRELDPSLIAARGREKTRQSKTTWWMPVSVNFKSISPQARLDWLETEDDLGNGPSLIAVTEPRTGHAWLVVDEHEGWYQWGVVDGERVIERHTWFTLNCLLVRKEQREQLVAVLSDKVFRERGDLAKLDLSSEGYIGEYPWHALYADLDIWAPEPIRDSEPVAVQPTVVDFLAETGGHDYSIEETFRFNVPAPGLIRGMNLHLVNGRDLTYADEAGVIRFFDPSTRESGPGAGLVDREAFLAFLARESLDAVWIIDGEKDVTGGRKHREGFGGSRLFTSLYWMSGNGFERRDFQRRETPTRDQLARFFGGDESAAAVGSPTSAKGPKPRSGTRTRRAAVKQIKKAGKKAQKKRSDIKKAKPWKKRTSQVPKSAAGRPKGRVRKK